MTSCANCATMNKMQEPFKRERTTEVPDDLSLSLSSFCVSLSLMFLSLFFSHPLCVSRLHSCSCEHFQFSGFQRDFPLLRCCLGTCTSLDPTPCGAATPGVPCTWNGLKVKETVSAHLTAQAARRHRSTAPKPRSCPTPTSEVHHSYVTIRFNPPADPPRTRCWQTPRKVLLTTDFLRSSPS